MAKPEQLSRLKTAVTIAKTFLGDVYPEGTEWRLEEVENSSRPAVVELTISFRDPTDKSLPGTFGQILGMTRTYKRVEINVETGEVLSMKIRKVE